MINAVLALLAAQAAAAEPVAEKPVKVDAPVAVPSDTGNEKPSTPGKPLFDPSEVRSTGSVTVGGRRIAYRAVAGTLVVHSKNGEDTDAVEAAAKPASKEKDEDEPKAEASM